MAQNEPPVTSADEEARRRERLEEYELLQTRAAGVLSVVGALLLLAVAPLSFASGLACVVAGVVVGVTTHPLYGRGRRLSLLLLFLVPFVFILSATGTLYAGLCFLTGYGVVFGATAGFGAPLDPSART